MQHSLSAARTDNKCEKIKFIYLVYLYVLIFPKLEETPFHYRGLECKSRKSRNTWSNRQIWPEAGQRLTDFSQENALVIANTTFQQHKTKLYTWTSPDGQHWNLIIFFAAKDGEALYSQQKQDRELTVARIMNSLLPNSGWNWRQWRKSLDHSGMT